MKIDTKKLNISKKQLVAIAAIAVTGVVLGTAILSNKTSKTAEDDGHGHGSHVEAKAHSDGEHHGKTSGDGHDHDKGHADGEHHEGPSKGLMAASCSRKEILGWRLCWPRTEANHACGSGCSAKISRFQTMQPKSAPPSRA